MSKETEGNGAYRELPERWSSKRKTEVVLRLFDGLMACNPERLYIQPRESVKRYCHIFVFRVLP